MDTLHKGDNGDDDNNNNNNIVISVTTYQATEELVGMSVQFHAFLALALERGVWSASGLSRFSVCETAHNDH
jgi:hypothetical protein